ncbi:amidohydrolase family protein [Amycolatopsis echigonensis]|uniref:Amidohydrolase family protein n=1 Tax=Amycolatopsis echigonensis TaxID=2576905 RepID=A0A8E1WA86_9PSEU|nr:amidohydrolase family protein [Amycolatopsis echigonensis]
MVEDHPDRFAAFATLSATATATDAAVAGLERAVGELGFVDATLSGRFLDDPLFTPVLETAARLDVPIYLRPATINQIRTTGDYG